MISKTFDIDLSQTQECNFSFIRGDSFQLIVNVTNNGTTFDMSGYYPILTGKATETATSASFQLYGADVDITNAGTGQLIFTFKPADTETLTAGVYFYDVQIDNGTQIYTLIKSTIELIQDITTYAFQLNLVTDDYEIKLITEDSKNIITELII